MKIALVCCLIITSILYSCTPDKVGCKDMFAANYDESAVVDGHCVYPTTRYNFWISEESLEYLSGLTDNKTIYFFSTESYDHLIPEEHFDQYENVGSIYKEATSTSQPVCGEFVIVNDTLRNIIIEAEDHMSRSLYVIISSSLTLNENSIIWSKSFNNLHGHWDDEDNSSCASIEIKP